MGHLEGDVVIVNKEVKFTSLAHLINEETLKQRAFAGWIRARPRGIHVVTYVEYERNLDANVAELVARMKTQKYYPQPVRRVYIPKGDGRQRPLGIPSIEDKTGLTVGR